MDGDKLLQAARRSKPLHHPLTFSKWEVAILRAIVEPFVRSMFKL